MDIIMRTSIIIALFLPFAAAAQVAQQPSAAVLAAFEKDFPNAMDVDWDLKGTQYKVEFETGILFTDHEVWYDAEGRQLRHEEEISEGDLPEAVKKSIAADFPGYRVDDVERITMEKETMYAMELKLKGQGEWKVAYAEDGRQLEKMAD